LLSGSEPALSFFCLLALLKSSGAVSSSCSGLLRFVLPLYFALRRLCLTIRRSHHRLSRAIGFFELIHSAAALRWINGRTRKTLLLTGNLSSSERNFGTNEYGLHAWSMKAVRINARAGGEEESCPLRQICEAIVSLSLSCIWRLIAHCAIAKRKKAVARNATDAGLGLDTIPRQ
jgi:hypothetical protein